MACKCKGLVVCLRGLGESSHLVVCSGKSVRRSVYNYLSENTLDFFITCTTVGFEIPGTGEPLQRYMNSADPFPKIISNLWTPKAQIAVTSYVGFMLLSSSV